MVNIRDSNGEGAQAPSPFARARLSFKRPISAHVCGGKTENSAVVCIINFNKNAVAENITLNVPEGTYRDLFANNDVYINQQYAFKKDAGEFCILEKV